MRSQHPGFDPCEWDTSESRPRKFYRTNRDGIRLAPAAASQMASDRRRTYPIGPHVAHPQWTGRGPATAPRQHLRPDRWAGPSRAGQPGSATAGDVEQHAGLRRHLAPPHLLDQTSHRHRRRRLDVDPLELLEHRPRRARRRSIGQQHLTDGGPQHSPHPLTHRERRSPVHQLVGVHRPVPFPPGSPDSPDWSSRQARYSGANSRFCPTRNRGNGQPPAGTPARNRPAASKAASSTTASPSRRATLRTPPSATNSGALATIRRLTLIASL